MRNAAPALFVTMRLLALGAGIAFPFAALLWKIIILIVFFAFRVADIEREKKLFGVTSMFFIGMIIGFTCRLIGM
jgi:hypothetical protein